MTDQSTRLSLAQHFSAPEGYSGHFGWLCGYSADAAFLNDAVERFSELTITQRESQGKVSLGVLLDPRNPQITQIETPGVAHFAIKDLSNQPFKLLHAKVALLGFKCKDNSGDWRLRLIVSTGNWTRQTLEESLDLAWCVDLDSHNISTAADKITANDIKAAHDLLNWLKDYFDISLLTAHASGNPSETAMACQSFENWVGVCVKQAKGPSRFFDNRNHSLLSQLPAKITASNPKPIIRNYLAMGSGFYESAATNKNPQVPSKLIKLLQSKSLLTASVEVDLFVNPAACQAIATSLTFLQEQGIKIRPAQSPEFIFGKNSARSLHAKFLFSCNSRLDSNRCSSSWVYLGSGNLTAPGFTLKIGRNSGNLEAGVVFSPKDIFWLGGKNTGITEHHVISNLLPIQRYEEIDTAQPLSVGSDMLVSEECFSAAPIAWLNWNERCELEAPTQAQLPSSFTVLNNSGQACDKTSSGFTWPESHQPRQVSCCWMHEEQQYQAYIPVIDAFGRIAATGLPAITIDEAWWQLANFPLDPDEELDDADSETPNRSSFSKTLSPQNSLIEVNYPIRQMMEWLENIATQQTAITEVDWPLWCLRLQQILTRSQGCQSVATFKELNLNPLSPLWQPAFRPNFAETSDSKAGALYEKTLAAIESSWQVQQLPAIGGEK